MLRHRLFSCTALAVLAACTRGEKTDKAPAVQTEAVVTAPPVLKASSNKPVKTWGKAVGFQTPESVLHDESADLYLVSNIEGKPLAKDGKAFISKLAPEADGAELKWIEGGKKGVTLNAPKGMAFLGDTLFIADIDTVRLFNRKDGSPTGEVKIPGAMFLNDVLATPDGRVLVSDMGMKDDGSGGLAPGGADAIYAIAKDRKVTTLTKTPDLNNPNGLAWSDKAFVVTFGSSELYALDPKSGTKTGVMTLPAGTLDGVVMAQGHFFVSSWESKTIYRGRPGIAFVPLIENVKSAADMGFDKTRKRLLVPLFEEDEVRAYDVVVQ